MTEAMHERIEAASDHLFPEEGQCGLDGPHVEQLKGPEAARRALQAFCHAGGTGWACFTDRVVRVDDPAALASGILLTAELANGVDSIALRPGNDGPILVRLSRIEGDDYESVAHRFVAVQPGPATEPAPLGGAATYEVFWPSRVDADGLADAWKVPVGPVASRFVSLTAARREQDPS